MTDVSAPSPSPPGAATMAFHAGLSGLLAMALQVLLLMWLRTAAAFQFRYGDHGGLLATLRHLHTVGGVRRLYAGVSVALVCGPLCRFCDTAANGFALAYLSDAHPLWQRTGFASLLAASLRIGLFPLDAVKTSRQVDGSDAELWARVRRDGFHVLFRGAMVALPIMLLGHFPWYFIHNTLDRSVPDAGAAHPFVTAARNAAIGVAAAVVADCSTNVLRVLKTTRQTDPTAPSYTDVLRRVAWTDGVRGLFLRGLGARLAASSLQSAFFNTAWHAIAHWI